MIKNNIEEKEAIAFSNWLKVNGYKFSHIANESGLPSKVAMLVAIKKKKMGTSPGFPDYCIILKRGSILFIEFKRTLTSEDYTKKGTLYANAPGPSEEQEEWLRNLDFIPNVSAIVCYGLQEAIQKVQEYENL